MHSSDPGSDASQEPMVVQARLAAIVESSDDAIVSKNLQGVVTSWNKGAERIFGWTSAEMVGQPITKIIPPDRQEEEPVILSRLARGERIDHFETIRMTKDGRLIDISVTISPIRDLTGRVIGASKIARDITLQKRLQEELAAAKSAAERAREEAESASRAKDHFLSVLSHELRTPLTPVLGAISLMERDASLPPDVQEQVAMIRRNVETEARLVDDLLDLTRIARGKIELHFEVVDAHAVVRNVLSMFDQDIDAKGLALSLALRARRHHVWADPGRFQQIVLNLVSNAVKFTPREGSIAVRTTDENGVLRIDVADSGVGIEPDVLPRLFQPFEQGTARVTRQFGGLGLGLSIVKSLVELHKAGITAASEGKGRGATFTLRLDTVSPDAAAAERPERRPASSTGPCRVLLVEDHADTRAIMARLLRSFGCEVTAAGTVRDAVAAAEAQPFDLLLSDIGLPDGTGMDVMRQIAHLSGHLKGVALSGYGQEEDLRRSMEAGFSTHLVKPVNVQALQDVIRRLAE